MSRRRPARGDDADAVGSVDEVAHRALQLRDLASRWGTPELRAMSDLAGRAGSASVKELLQLSEAFGAAAWDVEEGSPEFVELQEAAQLTEMAALVKRGDL